MPCGPMSVPSPTVLPASVVPCAHFHSRKADLSAPGALERSSSLSPWVWTISAMLLASTAWMSARPLPVPRWVRSCG